MKEECFALQPELLEAFRAKRARKTANQHQNNTVAMVESKQGATTAMLVIGTMDKNGNSLN